VTPSGVNAGIAAGFAAPAGKAITSAAKAIGRTRSDL
jgi:hypothetical protein